MSTATAPADARPAVLALAAGLRRTGVRVATGQVVAAVRAAGVLAPVTTADLYWVGRTVLVSHPGDLGAYDRVFHAVLGAERSGDGPAVTTLEATVGSLAGTAAAPGAERSRGGEDPQGVGAVAADAEVLRHRRFDRATDAELRAMRALMERIPLTVPRRATRRRRRARRGRELDLRRSLRLAVRTDGELIDRRWRRRRRRPRPLVLVLDVSGSMAGYSRALLQFAFSAGRHEATVEVFCLGTRLTRVTDELAGRDADAALAAAADRVVDWDGGTRIGACLDRLNRDHGRTGLLRGAVVVVCSDGLERGDPELLGRAAARLGRYAHRLVWVNPLSADERFRPVQRGMRAALPAVDHLVAGHDLASLEELAGILTGLR